jgi:hypothetical protein
MASHVHASENCPIKVWPLGCVGHISMTTFVVSALKNYHVQSYLEVPTDILNHFWIQAAVLLLNADILSCPPPYSPPPFPYASNRGEWQGIGFLYSVT